MSLIKAAPGMNHSPFFYWLNRWPGFYKLYLGTFFRWGKKAPYDSWNGKERPKWAVRIHIVYLKREGMWPKAWLCVGVRRKDIYHQIEGFSYDTNKGA